VIVQDDRFSETDSVTVCAFTSDPIDAPLIRLAVSADEVNGLHRDSHLTVEKLVTLPRAKLGQRLGQLADEDMIRLRRAMVVFLGLAGA
jgi:mRNA interferase MazF